MTDTTAHENATQWLYMTAANRQEAQIIARTLVEERLVACANILGDIESFYRWEGAVQNDAEVALILKTRSVKVNAVTQRIKALHSYDCPCVVALDIQGGNPAFIDWIVQETD